MKKMSFFHHTLIALALSVSVFFDAAAENGWNAVFPCLIPTDQFPTDLNFPTPPMSITDGKIPLGKCAITPDGTTAYIACGETQEASFIFHFDILSQAYSTPIYLNLDNHIGQFPGFIAITPDGERAYVGCLASHDVWVLDLATREVLARIADGLDKNSTPIGIAITPDGQSVYVTDGFNTVSIIDTTTNEVTSSIKLKGSNSPEAITMTPDGATALVICKPLIGSKCVIPINLQDNTPGTPIIIDNDPSDITVTASGKTAYVSCQSPGTLVPIDIPTLTALEPIPIDGHLISVDITPDDKIICVGVSNGMTENGVVVLFEVATGIIGTPITLGVNPSSLIIAPDQAPIADFLALVDPSSFEVIFDASASHSPVGTIQQYDWDFGDGTQTSTDTPIITHAYNAIDSYEVTLKVTNSAGTSTTQVFTGQTMTRNGGPAATTSQTVILDALSTSPSDNF